VKAMTAFTGLFVQAPKADPRALFRKALGEGWPMIDGNPDTLSGDGEWRTWRGAGLGRPE